MRVPLLRRWQAAAALLRQSRRDAAASRGRASHSSSADAQQHSRPLRLFICAGDDAADRAAAALVAALKAQHKAGVELLGLVRLSCCCFCTTAAPLSDAHCGR